MDRDLWLEEQCSSYIKKMLVFPLNKFCLGLSTQENYWMTPFKEKNPQILALITLWNWVSTILENLGTINLASNLCFMRYTYVNRVQSSSKCEKKYVLYVFEHDMAPKYRIELD